MSPFTTLPATLIGLLIGATGVVVAGVMLARSGDGIAARTRIGPLRLGSLPDIDLVPEIVAQAYAAANLIDMRARPQRQAG